jgi:RNA polymerase sigma-70 factor (ECF subfamily)
VERRIDGSGDRGAMTQVSDERALWLARNALPHEPALRRWLAGKRLRGIDLDDIIQETYAILAGLESVDAIRNAKAYMFQTAYSVILAQVRRAQIVSISTIDDIGQLADADGAPSPETVVSDRQELQRLADAIAALPDRCREVFVLRKIYGLQQRDVAQRLGVSEGTVEKQLHRGLNLVIAMFGRGGNPPRQASITKNNRRSARNTDA